MNKKWFLNLFGVVLFIFLIYLIDFKKIISIISSANFLFVLLSLILIPIIAVFRGARWFFLVKSLDINLSFFNSVKFYLMGASLGAVTPGRLGNFFRAKLLKDKSDSSLPASFSTVVADNLVDGLTLLFFSIAGILILFYREIAIVPLYYFLAIILFTIIGLFVYFKREKFFPIIKPLFFRFFKSDKIKLNLKELHHTLKKIESHKKFVSFSVLSSLASWLLILLAAWFISFSLNLNLSYIDVLIAVSVSSLIVIIPISISGLGTRESTIIFLFSFWSIPADMAISFSILVALITAWSFAFLGSLFWFKFRISRKHS